MKKAIITIPDTIEGMNCETNGVHPIVMVNAMNMLAKHFSRELVAMAEKEVGKNQKLQARYFDRLTKQYLGGNPGDLKIDPNLFN